MNLYGFEVDLVTFYSLIFALIIGLIILSVTKRIRRGGKTILVEVINKNRTIDKAKPYPIKENKVKIEKDQVDFDPDKVFIENKSWLKFWKKPNFKLLWPEGAKTFLGWKKTEQDKSEFSELSHEWSKKEIGAFIKKLVTLSATTVKPISRFEFIVLVIILVMNIILGLIIANRLGIF